MPGLPMLSSLLGKTARKRSPSDAELLPRLSSNLSEDERLDANATERVEQSSISHQGVPPEPRSGPITLSRSSTVSTLQGTDQHTVQSRVARLSVVSAHARDNQFDSDTTLVDSLRDFAFPQETISDKANKVSVPSRVGESKFCTCTCSCDGSLLPRDRRRDKKARIRVGIRYGFMFVHTSLTLATLMIALWRRDIILIGMIGALAIAWLIYVPAAFALCLARVPSRFDHVGGEIAYLCVQIGGYLGIYPSVLLSLTECDAEWDNVDWISGQVTGGGGWTNVKWCNSLRSSMGLGYGHMLVMVAWLVYVLFTSMQRGLRSRGGPGLGRTLQISTGWLLSGWPISPAEKAKPM